MTFATAIASSSVVAARPPARRTLTVHAAKKQPASTGKRRLDSTGYIVDNSERGNIFAVEPRQLYTSSPRSDRAARQGLGGLQGLLVLAGVCAVVAAITAGVAGNPADSLQDLTASSADNLSDIAGRLAAGL